MSGYADDHIYERGNEMPEPEREEEEDCCDKCGVPIPDGGDGLCEDCADKESDRAWEHTQATVPW